LVLIQKLDRCVAQTGNNLAVFVECANVHRGREKFPDVHLALACVVAGVTAVVKAGRDQARTRSIFYGVTTAQDYTVGQAPMIGVKVHDARRRHLLLPEGLKALCKNMGRGAERERGKRGDEKEEKTHVTH